MKKFLALIVLFSGSYSVYGMQAIDKYITELSIAAEEPQEIPPRVIIAPYVSTALGAGMKQQIMQTSAVILSGFTDMALRNRTENIEYKLDEPLLINIHTNNPELLVQVIGAEGTPIKSELFKADRIRRMGQKNNLEISMKGSRYASVKIKPLTS